MLVNPEGSPVCSTLPAEIDSARLASITATLYSNNDVSIQRMNRGTLSQMTLLTNEGILQLHRIREHILVVFTAEGQQINLEGLIKVVEDLSAQLVPLLDEGRA